MQFLVNGRYHSSQSGSFASNCINLLNIELGLRLHDFTPIEIKEAQLEAHENLRMLSQHMHINAFHDVWLGSNTCGLLESLTS